MNELFLLIIGCILSGIGTILVIQFTGMRSDLKEIGDSVKTLNIQIAEIIKDQAWHKEEIVDLKSRILFLETRVDQGKK